MDFQLECDKIKLWVNLHAKRNETMSKL